MTRRWWLLTLAVVTSCEEQRFEPGMRAEIRLGKALASKGLRLAAYAEPDAGSWLSETECMGIDGERSSPVLVGIVQAKFPTTIFLQATGFADAHCDVATDPPEQSDEVEASFASFGVVEADLFIRGHERDCANGDDDDDDRAIDCKDSDCEDKACHSSNRCVTETRCRDLLCIAGNDLKCVPPSACFNAICNTLTGCNFSVITGKACEDGGTCGEDGGCVVP